MDIIWWTWFGGITLFHSSVITIFSEKGFRFWPKKSFRALVGTIGLHSNSGTSLMSMVIKGMIRITNEDRQLLSSLAILIIPLTARLIKDVPELECRPIVPTIGRIFHGRIWAKIWNLFLKTNCNNRRMKESYATKLCPQNCTHLCFILSKFEYHQCIW